MSPNDALTATSIDTFAGPLAVIVTSDEAVVGSGFGSVEQIAARLPADLSARGLRTRRDLGSVTAAVLAYSLGDLDALDTVPARQSGAPFTQEVWTVMRQIRPGSPWTYAELATKAGRPAAVRAVGNACARNLLAPFVPCHRVVLTSGGLGGYAYGLTVKERLLAHEARAGSA